MYNFEEKVEFITKYNILGLKFFDQTENLILDLANQLNIPIEQLDSTRGSLSILGDVIFSDNIHDEARRRELFNKLSINLMAYIYQVQEKTFNRKRAFIKYKSNYCPILTDKSSRIDLCFLLYIPYTFGDAETSGYTHLYSAYSTKANRRSIEFWQSQFIIENEYEVMMVDG
jgi:hypothetical protein